MEAGEYTRFIYIGVEDPELYAIHLCFKAEELQYINFWPRTLHIPQFAGA